MTFRKIEIAPERVSEGRRLYERTLTPMADIAEYMGISPRTLKNRIDEWGWTRRRDPARRIELHHAARGAALAELTKSGSAGAEPEPVSQEQRAALAARIHAAVERAIAATERVIEQIDPSDESEVERNARSLASISRTLREFAALNRSAETKASHETDDDPIPLDIDEFRYELARRIRGFIEARQARVAGLLDDPASALD